MSVLSGEGLFQTPLGYSALQAGRPRQGILTGIDCFLRTLPQNLRGEDRRPDQMIAAMFGTMKDAAPGDVPEPRSKSDRFRESRNKRISGRIWDRGGIIWPS